MPQNPFLAAALAAASKGLHVFPLAPNSKVPAIRDWENAATTDYAQIRRWWSGKSRKNLGLAVGRSELLVIDLDEHPGDTPPPEWEGAIGGRDVLARLAHEAGEPYPAATYTVATPSGGRHLYFRMPDGLQLRNTAGTLGWRIISSRSWLWLVSPLFGSESREARGSCGVRRAER